MTKDNDDTRHEELVEVTQADREAAVEYMRLVDRPRFAAAILSGVKDDAKLVQAFARHRLNTRNAPPVDAVEAVLALVEKHIVKSMPLAITNAFTRDLRAALRTEREAPADAGQGAQLWPGLDYIANFINALDSEGMTNKQIRSVIYSECLEPGCKSALRQPPSIPPAIEDEREACAKVAEEFIHPDSFFRGCTMRADHQRTIAAAIRARTVSRPSTVAGEIERLREADTLHDIAEMMSEFVDNWPEHKKVSTSIALIAKTLRASRDEVAALRQPPSIPPVEVERLREALRRELATWSLNGSFANGSLANYFDGIWECLERARTALADTGKPCGNDGFLPEKGGPE